MPQRRIYLDHAATTPILPAAGDAMVEAMRRWANPSSPHAEGRTARAALEDARERIKTALGWSGSIIFTSGASEALQIALQRAKGAARYVSAVEHDAVFRAAPNAERLPVDQYGIVLLPSPEHSGVYAVQHANSETGVIQPLDRVAEIVRNRGALLLADCAQTAGKLPLPDADMIAISAHKFGGPPGVGALLLRDLAMIDAMGGQEQGYRPGTENLPGILGMAAALEAGSGWMDRIALLRQRLERAIEDPGGETVGGGCERIATIGAYRMPGVASTTQLIQFDMAGIAVSAGSACSSGSMKPSHVLAAMGWREAEAREVVRVSFGWTTTEEDIDRFAEVWTATAARRRAA